MTKQIKELNNVAVKLNTPEEKKIIIALFEAAGFERWNTPIAFSKSDNYIALDNVDSEILGVRQLNGEKLITLDQLIWGYGIAPSDTCNYACWVECDNRIGWFERKEDVHENATLISTRPQETQEYMPEVGEEWKGEGIPPKGLVCLIRFKVDSTSWSGWRKGYFKGGYDSKIWLGQSDLQADDLIMFSHDVEFKPLPTKQEIEREEFVNDAIKVVGCELENIPEVFARMFDNGCRFSAKLPKE